MIASPAKPRIGRGDPLPSPRLEFEGAGSTWQQAKKLVDNYFKFCNKLEYGEVPETRINHGAIAIDSKSEIC